VRREAIRAMFAKGAEAGMKPTFTQLEVTLQNPLPEIERFLPENLHWIERQQQDQLGRPLFHDSPRTQPVTKRVLFPGLYYAHVDLSKNRCATGIVVGHAIGAKQVARLDERTMQTVYEKMPLLRIDLALRVVPPANGEIDIPKVRSLIYRLRNMGCEFGLVTFDTFGSQESIKSLKDQGINADTYSVASDLTPWEEMKQALYDGRLVCFEFPYLEKELAQLEMRKGTVEKPSQAGASKDVADCLAAVVHHVEEGWRRGAGSDSMFQLGLIEWPQALVAANAIDRQARAFAAVIDGRPYDEDDIFGI